MPGFWWNIGRLGFTPQQSKLQCGFKWNLTRDAQYALLLPFVPVWGENVYDQNPPVWGRRGGKAAGRGHPGKNAGKLEEKCIKMISLRTQKLPSWDRVWGKEISAGWLVGKVLTD